MADHPAFLADVIANPEDDTPRLVYADWLDENAGSPADHGRAELIRVQCRSAGLPAYDPLRLALEARAADLLDEHARTWAGHLKGLVSYPLFRRGFVEEASVGSKR